MSDLNQLKDGLKQHQIAKCGCCGKGVGHNQNPTFYRVTIELHIINLPAVRRQVGLEIFLGNAALASVMGADEPMSRVMSETLPAVICLDCAVRNGIAEISEKLPKANGRGEDDLKRGNQS